mgnify:FL=1
MENNRKDQTNDNIHWLYIKYLNGKTSFAEDTLLGQALRGDPSLSNRFQLWEHEWEQAYAGNEDTNKSWNRSLDKFRAHTMRVHRLRAWQVAASIAVLVITIGSLLRFGISKMSRPRQYVYTVPFGHTSKVVLPDSSVVWLNAGSRLSYTDFSRASVRQVYLKGEGYFEVRHMDSKPFVVSTKRLRVQVLGTKFNVNAYAPSTDVVLLSGAVSVKANNDEASSRMLLPGEQYQLSAEGKVSVKNVKADDFASWKSGMLTINEMTLRAFAKKLENYYGVPVRVSSDIENLAYSGVIDLHCPINTALSDLSQVLPIKVLQADKGFMITHQ